jgi:pectate lyase
MSLSHFDVRVNRPGRIAAFVAGVLTGVLFGSPPSRAEGPEGAASPPAREIAFDGALGFGRFARGGAGGPVITVTTLEDYYAQAPPIAGSLRWAIEQHSGPRTIVFENGGVIALTRPLSLFGDPDTCVTIDGRTPDGLGVTITRFEFGIFDTHDIIVRYMRFRSSEDGEQSHGMRSLNILGETQSPTHDVIIDHCSIQRSDDDDLDVWDNAYRITIQWCFVGDGRSPHGSKAGLFGGAASPASDEYLTLCYNLFSNAYHRVPRIGAPGRVDFYNNAVAFTVLYMMILTSDRPEAGSPRINILNNTFEYQSNYPWSPPFPSDPIVAGADQLPTPEAIYIEGNYFYGFPPDQWDLTGDITDPDQGGHANLPSNLRRASAWPTDAVPENAQTARARILAEGGCRVKGELDRIDQQILTNIEAGHAKIPPF